MEKYGFKDFAADCLSAGYGYAALVCPPILAPVVVPVLGPVLAVTLAPVANASAIGIDKLSYKIPLWQRRKVGPFEKQLADLFGRVAVEGYPYYGGGVCMTLPDVKVVDIDEAAGIVRDVPMYASALHHNREQCAKDLLGKFAEAAAESPRNPAFKRYIAGYDRSDFGYLFLRAARHVVQDGLPTPDLLATRRYYSDAMGRGRVESEATYRLESGADSNDHQSALEKIMHDNAPRLAA